MAATLACRSTLLTVFKEMSSDIHNIDANFPLEKRPCMKHFLELHAREKENEDSWSESVSLEVSPASSSKGAPEREMPEHPEEEQPPLPLGEPPRQPSPSRGSNPLEDKDHAPKTDKVPASVSYVFT